MSWQIDPNRTVSAGKVEIGAFRTYPEVSLNPTELRQVRYLPNTGLHTACGWQFTIPVNSYG